MAEALYREITSGDMVDITGSVTEYNGNLQINIETCFKADKTAAILNDCRPCTEKNVAEMLSRFSQIIGQVHDPSLTELLTAIFAPDMITQFSQTTAARTIHHAYAGGFLEHTLEVMEYCLKILDVQGDMMNPDLLLAGAALHDIGKL